MRVSVSLAQSASLNMGLIESDSWGRQRGGIPRIAAGDCERIALSFFCYASR